jgi:hypothetical protein
MERPKDITERQIQFVMAQTCADWSAFMRKNLVDQIDSGLQRKERAVPFTLDYGVSLDTVGREDIYRCTYLCVTKRHFRNMAHKREVSMPC